MYVNTLFSTEKLLDMILAVDWSVKPQHKQKQNLQKKNLFFRPHQTDSLSSDSLTRLKKKIEIKVKNNNKMCLLHLQNLLRIKLIKEPPYHQQTTDKMFRFFFLVFFYLVFHIVRIA